MEERKKALAIKYDQSKDNAPVVVAKGSGQLAEKIIETARQNGVPVLEDRNLISAMMKVEIYEEIPPELYRAVARVLIFVGAVKKSG